MAKIIVGAAMLVAGIALMIYCGPMGAAAMMALCGAFGSTGFSMVLGGIAQKLQGQHSPVIVRPLVEDCRRGRLRARVRPLSEALYGQRNQAMLGLHFYICVP